MPGPYQWGMPLHRTALLTLTAALAACGPVMPATPAPTSTITLPGDAVFPEGVTYRPATKTFYVTSTTDGTIFSGRPDQPAASVFLAGGADGRTTAVGLKVDDAGRLYVAGGGTGKIFVYDTTTKALLRAYDTSATAATFINDVALTAEGAYFTDSQRPILFRVDRAGNGAGELTAWLNFTGTALTYQPGFNLNGIAATPDGRYLVVVQSNTGKLFRIRVSDKAVTEIDLGGATVPMGDGLLLDGQTLYVVRNAATRIVPVTLGADFTSGTVGKDFTDSTLRFPTTVAQADGRLLVVNSQFDKRAPGLTPELPFTVSNIAKPR